MAAARQGRVKDTMSYSCINTGFLLATAALLGSAMAGPACALHAADSPVVAAQAAASTRCSTIAASWSRWWADFLSFLRDRNRLILFLTLGVLLGLYIMLRR